MVETGRPPNDRSVSGGRPDPPAVDAFFGELQRAGERRQLVKALLGEPLDEVVLAAVLRRSVPVAFLEELAATWPWSERPEILARIVLHPKVPRGLALRLTGSLHWRELADVAGTMRVSVAVRVRAEGLLRDMLPELRLGDRITFARLATPALVPLLLADSEPRVVEAALTNARLREEDLVAALRREQRTSTLVVGVAASTRWSASYAVRLALVLQPRTPLPLALQRISGLVPRDLRRLAEDSTLHPLVREAAHTVLERGRE